VETQAGRRSIPTAPEPTDLGRQARARLGRRLFVVVLAAFLLLGALGFYGVRTKTATASAAGYELSVRYASISRPGVATPWSFEVRRAGGFPDGLTVAVTSSYFDAFDENGLGPAPVEERADEERTIWRFGPSGSEVISVSFDARIEPGVQLTTIKGELAILSGPTGPPVVTVGFKTFVMP
jgi:hypothetical protein